MVEERERERGEIPFCLGCKLSGTRMASFLAALKLKNENLETSTKNQPGLQFPHTSSRGKQTGRNAEARKLV